jgi:hypothetical protein
MVRALTGFEKGIATGNGIESIHMRQARAARVMGVIPVMQQVDLSLLRGEQPLFSNPEDKSENESESSEAKPVEQHNGTYSN